MPALRRSLFFSFLEKNCTLLINILAIVILSRLLTPVETGVYSVAAGIINIAQTLREFGIGNYIIQEEELTRPRLATALGISVLFGVIMATIFLTTAGPISAFYAEPRIKTVIVILSPSFIGIGFAAIGFARMRRDMNFKAVLRIGIAQTLVHSTTSITLAALGFGAIGMAWAALAGVAVNLIGNYLCYPEDLSLLPRFTEWRRICGFGVFATGGYLLQELSERMPDIVVGRFLGFESAGLYSRGNGFVTLFQQALMNAIIPVANSALASLHRADEDIRQPFLRFVEYTTAVAWPVLGLMSLLTLPIIQVAFGRQWLGAVPPARIFCLAAALLVLARASLTLFSATGAVKRLFGVQCVSVPVEIAAIIVGSRFSIQAAAAGTVVSGLILAGLCLHNVNQLIGTSWRQIAVVLGHSLLLTLGTLALPVAITISLGVTSSEHLWLSTGLAGISGIISWLFCIWGTRHPLRDEMIAAFAKLKSIQTH